jgi:hypothetical protein
MKPEQQGMFWLYGAVLNRIKDKEFKMSCSAQRFCMRVASTFHWLCRLIPRLHSVGIGVPQSLVGKQSNQMWEKEDLFANLRGASWQPTRSYSAL